MVKKREVPEVVSLVALGDSKTAFFHECMMTGKPKGVANEVWAINKLGVIIKHDVVWRMDDLSEVVDCNEKLFSGGCLGKEAEDIHTQIDTWMKNHDKPIITSKAYPEIYPTSVEYPLEAVINKIGFSYFRTTPAYAAAFAIYIGVKQLRVFGCDFVYPGSAYVAEAGRANMEFILGIGMTMGMDVYVPPTSTLLDTCIPIPEKIYGYKDTFEVLPDPEDEKKWKVVPNPDIGRLYKEEIEKREKAMLKEYMVKYKDDVTSDILEANWITKDDIDNFVKPKPLLEAPPEKGASQVETLKGDKNAKSTKVRKRSNKRK